MMTEFARLCLFSLMLLVNAEAKNYKRGVAYNIKTRGDIGALSAGCSWFYNWSPFPARELPDNFRNQFDMEFVPMLWNFNYDHNAVVDYMKRNNVKNFLVLNEPNLKDQANMHPSKAAELWPKYEAVARATGARIIGPQITWGTTEFNDPIKWMDAFLGAFRSQHGREPQIDALGFHWYDYGLWEQLIRLEKYGKPFWVTEFANWHVGNGPAQIDTEEKQIAEMYKMTQTLDDRQDVERYSWFTGRWTNEGDWHHTSLLTHDGALSLLGVKYCGPKCEQ